MTYTELFRQWREKKGLTLDGLAKKARCHRNTVCNVEYGMPVKFRTIAKLVKAMGGTEDDLVVMAVLWVEHTSGLDLSSNRNAYAKVAALQEPVRKALESIRLAARKMTVSDVQVLAWAAKNKGAMAILKSLKNPSTLNPDG